MTKDDIIKEAEVLCKKFVNKVDMGLARSRETYSDCRHLLKHIEELEANNTQPGPGELLCSVDLRSGQITHNKKNSNQ